MNASTDAEQNLLETLAKVEALFAGTSFDGERMAAANTIERIRERLRQTQAADPPAEFKFSLNNVWSRKLFMALLRRYGIAPYRYSGQRYTTVMARVSRRFVDETLWPEFQQLDKVLASYLESVTDRVVQAAIFADNSEAETRAAPAALADLRDGGGQ